jgi:hypothetical protein
MRVVTTEIRIAFEDHSDKFEMTGDQSLPVFEQARKSSKGQHGLKAIPMQFGREGKWRKSGGHQPLVHKERECVGQP